MNSDFREDLERKFKDEEFVKDFGESIAKVDIAQTLTEARIISKVTQKDLANKLGTSQSYIAKLERGDANPSIGRIGRFLAVLGLRLWADVIPLSPVVVSDRKTSSARTIITFPHERGIRPSYSTYCDKRKVAASDVSMNIYAGVR